MEHYAVVFFPQIDTITINNFRQKYDPKYAVLNPHITLIFPFSGIPEEKIIEHLQLVTDDRKSFEIALNGLMKSFDDYLFLLVNKGKEEIYNLHDQLYSGIFENELRSDIPFIPHITLGYFRSKNNEFNSRLYETAYKEAEEINSNFKTVFNSIALIRGNGKSPAKTVKTFEFK